MEIEYKIDNDKLYRKHYELLDGKKWSLDDGNGKLILTKDEFIACYKAWIENTESKNANS